MRVLHVIPYIHPRFGGPSTVIWPMLRALRDIPGLDVELATTTFEDGDDSFVPGDAGTVHLRKGPGPGELAEWVDGHIREYDLMHSHSLWNPFVNRPCRSARRARIPYIVRPCGMLSEYSWQSSPLRKRAYWWLFQRANLRDAAALHATSAVEAADIRAAGVTAPVHEIPLGMETVAFDAPVQADWLRSRCPEAGDRPIVLFLSRIHPKKGIVDFLLPAFAKLSTDAYLGIAGGTDPEHAGYEAEIRRTIERLGLTHRAFLLGQIQPEDRWFAFDGAAVFCLPSHSENFGVVVTEAMARGCPVVVSVHVDAGTHAVAAGSGAMVPLEVDALAAELDRRLAAGRQAGECGRAYVREELSWAPLAARIAEMYRSIHPTCGKAL